MGYEDIRISPRQNEKAFLRHNEKLGYTGVMDWMLQKGLHTAGMYDVMEEALADKDSFAKALGPLATTTAGAHQNIYGANAWLQFQLGQNAFQLLGTRIVENSGFRAVTAQSSTALPGRPETADLGAPLIAEYAEVQVNSKIVDHLTAISHLQMALQGKDDVLSAANAVEQEKQTFFNRVNRNVLHSVNVGAPGVHNMNSLHQLTESNAHIAAAASVAANSADFYNIDRDAGASWADSYVNYNTAAADTPRPLSRAYIDDVIQATGNKRLPATSPYGRGIMLTGGDTSAAIDQLVEAKQRIVSQMDVNVTVNGVSVAPGQEGSMRVNAYKNQPIFIDELMPAPNSGISDILFIDTSVTSMGILRGVEFLSSGDALLNNQHADRYMWRMFGNVWVTQPSANGKLTDIE